MRSLTERQQQILAYIRDSSARRGSTPTVREVASHFNISVGPAQRHLKALLRKGFITHRPGVSRGIDVPSRRPLASVPVLGSVPAGIPLEAVEQAAHDHIYIDRERLPGEEYFALRVRGDSMIGAGIFENDLVVVRRQPVAEDGEIVVAVINGEATVKKLRRRPGEVYLEAANPAYKPLTAREIDIVGKVVYLMREC